MTYLQKDKLICPPAFKLLAFKLPFFFPLGVQLALKKSLEKKKSQSHGNWYMPKLITCLNASPIYVAIAQYRTERE